MATLEKIDRQQPLDITPYQHDLDRPSLNFCDGASGVVLTGQDVALFLAWAARWRPELEKDLQSIAQDSDGNALLTTWMPLVTFRESFCAGGRHEQDAATRGLMERLRSDLREWRGLGVDTVDISGRVFKK